MQYLSAEGSARIGEEIETIEMAIGFQRIAMQNTGNIEILPGLNLCDATPLPHEGNSGISAQKAGGNPEPKFQFPSRHRALVMREIPLYVLPAALHRGAKEKGETAYRIIIFCSHQNHHTIKTRCNTKTRECTTIHCRIWINYRLLSNYKTRLNRGLRVSRTRPEHRNAVMYYDSRSIPHFYSREWNCTNNLCPCRAGAGN